MSLPSRRLVLPFGEFADELVVAVGLQPLLEASLRAAPLSTAFATDASEAQAGGCETAVGKGDWDMLYSLAEE